MKSRKLLSLFVAVAMLLAVLAGCTSTPAVTTTPTAAATTAPVDATTAPVATATEEAPKVLGEKLVVRFVMPGDPADGEAIVDKAINDKLEKDGYNLTYTPIYVPWDIWEQKTNLMMNTGEPFELLQVMDTWISAASIVGRGGIIPIGAVYLDQYGPNIKKVIPDWVFESGKINGKIYTIPAFAIEPALRTDFVTYRKDLFDKYNLKTPTSPDELFSAIETIFKGENDKKLMYLPDDGDSQMFLHRWYDTYPFFIQDQLVFVDKSGNAKSWVETDEFKSDCSFNRKLYVGGITSPDILNLAGDVRENANKYAYLPVYESGDALGWWPEVKKNNPTATLEDFLPAPEKPLTRFEVYSNSNAISATSPNPEAGVMFFDWVYSNQENYDLLHYGIKDMHWKDLGEHKIEMVTLEKDKYGYSAWMSENFSYLRFTADIHPTLLQINTKTFPGIDYNAMTSFVTVGFRFDTVPVATEYVNCLAVANTAFRPLANGVVDYDKEFSAALAQMKAAGIDKVVAEYQTQLKAFMDAKK